MPEPTIDEDFKGYWTLNHEAVTDEIIINEDTVLQFKTYQDKNDNWIDDFSEAFTVNFVTNTGGRNSKSSNWLGGNHCISSITDLKRRKQSLLLIGIQMSN